ncbi:FG-GAP-like repeat-containing protein [Streptomyces sp. NPDC004609]|uniref:FG-GAP-like repeat-containing protein n=1 Tax=Streptomyces sp. NPDC004609 TaxID=3364704 RepID=UPI003685B822
MARYIRARRSRGRTTLIAVALVASVVVASPVTPAAATDAGAAGTGAASGGGTAAPRTTAAAAGAVGAPLEITPNWRDLPRDERIAAVGTKGFVHAPEDTVEGTNEPHRWTDFETGKSVELGHGGGNDQFAEFGTGGDYVYGEHGAGPAYIRNVVTGTERELDLPQGDRYVGLLGDSVLVQRYLAPDDWSDTSGWYLLKAGDPAGAEVAVTGWPAGADLHGARLVAGDGTEAVVRFDLNKDSWDFTELGLIDLTTGRMRHIGASTTDNGGVSAPVAVSPDSIGWIDRNRQMHVRERARPEGPGQTFPLPEGIGVRRIGLVDGWVLAFGDVSGSDAALKRNLIALSVDGQRRHTLLEKADLEIAQMSSGAAAVVGGSSATDWRLLQVVAGADGGVPRLEKLGTVAPLPAKIDAFSLNAGVLSTVEQSGPEGAGFYNRDLAPGPAPDRESAPVWIGREQGRPYDYTPCGQHACTRLLGSGDGRSVYQVRNYASSQAQVEIVGRRSAQEPDRALTGNFDGFLVDSFGRYAVYQSGRAAYPGTVIPGEKTIVVDLEAKPGASVVVQREQTGAAVWGTTLYTGTAPGVVTRTDLPSGRNLGTIATGADGDLAELQVVGHWLYWASGGSRQGVVDLRSGARIALPRGYSGGLLGDGFFVDKQSDMLRILDFHSGTAVTRYVGGSTPDYVPGDRRQTWTVDRFGGAIAYRTPDGTLRVVPSGVPTSALAAVPVAVPAAFHTGSGWKPSWSLSKPAASWRLTVRNRATGATVHTVTGGETRGVAEAAWNGRDAAGGLVPNGTYAWTLTGVPADGQGAGLVVNGTVDLAGGTAAHRDHAGAAGPDGVADLMTLNASGVLAFRHGNGAGGFTGATTGRIWSSTAVAVPFGDMNGDRCNEVLVRLGGQLRAYRPGCGKGLTPSAPYTLLGTVWAQFDVLTSPGDLTGDGRPDLIARQQKTGDVYLYADDGRGGLKARGRIAVNWKGYRAVFGAGDLNGDGIGDVLAVDAAHSLWRFNGTAAGTLKPRALVFGAKWGTGRNAFVGAGDLNKDGKADLISRNAAGDLLRNNGNGSGSFGSTARLAPGWQGYKIF